MPRVAREKSFDSIYHIMVRSISEVNLYKDEKDKLKYIDYMKKAQDQFEFKLYAYCLMDNHAHFVIDANGAD
ncbi:MAG: transposase, partial [Fischerella sp.]|nr:transposase [Fischerella sp.]